MHASRAHQLMSCNFYMCVCMRACVYTMSCVIKCAYIKNYGTSKQCHQISITVQLNQRGYYANLKKLVGTTYEQNNNTKVTLVFHSMGGPVYLCFLALWVKNGMIDTFTAM